MSPSGAEAGEAEKHEAQPEDAGAAGDGASPAGRHPYRWGDPAQPAALPEAAARALPLLGARPPEHGPVGAAGIALPEPALPAEAREALAGAVGAEHVATGHEARVTHAGGWSTPDLLRLRAGDGAAAPDAVVFPGSHEEVLGVLRACARRRVAVVPYGGGTSVVGGLAPARAGFAGVVAVDLRRLDALLHLDTVSRTAAFQAGVRAPRAEELLAPHGFTLGHFPQSYEGAGLGGCAATRSAGQASGGYGRFDEMVTGLVLATPRGTVELGRAPMSAAGPDLRQLVLGSEGTLGVITSVTLRMRPVPARRVYEGWRFGSFDAGTAALRRLAQDGPLPTVLRLSDETETAAGLADPDGLPGGQPGGGGSGALAVAGFEGGAREVEDRRRAAAAVLTASGGTPLGTGPGRAWHAGRYRAPYLRDPLLDAGVLVETLETAAFWSALPALRAAVSDALTAALAEQGTRPLVMCHISHVYETGASLYFTVVCAQTEDPLAQWREAKRAANEAILAAGGTITHHHGVGTDHRDGYAREIGPLALEALRAAKRSLDPEGILNPGVLLGDGRACG